MSQVVTLEPFYKLFCLSTSGMPSWFYMTPTTTIILAIIGHLEGLLLYPCVPSLCHAIHKNNALQFINRQGSYIIGFFYIARQIVHLQTLVELWYFLCMGPQMWYIVLRTKILSDRMINAIEKNKKTIVCSPTDKNRLVLFP